MRHWLSRLRSRVFILLGICPLCGEYIGWGRGLENAGYCAECARPE